MEQNNKIDELTGLFGFDRFLEDMKKCRQFGCYGYLLILGIDNFKNINMKYGRSFGDQVLVLVAESLQGDGPRGKQVYRLDGDRFAVMFPGGDQTTVKDMFEKVRGDLREYCTLSGGSIGCAPNCGVDCGTIYQYAEHAMDIAKEDGKDGLIFFSHESYQERLDKISLLEEFRKSVKNGMKGFSLNYQPLVDSRTFGIYGFEALLRYSSPERGRITPDKFIPILEDSELICEAGEWVLRNAVLCCREWRQKFPDFHININLSYVQLRQENFGEKVLEILEDTEIPGEAVTLEVTESMKLEDTEFFNRLFHQWREKGITVSIDDFGTGYSNLSYLKSLHVDEVKIDRCFVEHIQDRAYNYRLMGNMIEIAHSAGARVCCEGIETEEELMAVRELDADLFQGFLFSMPDESCKFVNSYMVEDSPEFRKRLAAEEYFRSRWTDTGEMIQNLFSKEEFGIIVDELDELICVSDMDTCELYYVNIYGRKLTGIDDYRGHKCYEALRGRDKPCADCSGCRTGVKKFRTWEVENERLNCRMTVKNKVIPWQGKPPVFPLLIRQDAFEQRYFYEKEGNEKENN